MNKKNILVFPCGSEIGLEVYRSLCYSTHLSLVGASSVNDHGRFIFPSYIGNLPNVDHPDFISKIKSVVAKNEIDAIYPTMDTVIHKLKQHESELGCLVISSPLETTEICTSKGLMYDLLKGTVLTPKVFDSAKKIVVFPVFVKPDKGYGSRGAIKIENQMQLESHLQLAKDSIVMEFLPGNEYTVDCFTNYNGELLFAGPRQRSRIMNGISVNSATMSHASKPFKMFAEKINAKINLSGAWFFQVRENAKGELVLLEVAARLGGTSGLHRVQGVNFALLSVFDAFRQEVSVIVNNFDVEVDRALDSKFKIDIDFDTAYIDLDDTLIVNGKINVLLIALVYQFIDQKKRVVLITKHESDINETLKKYRLVGLFDEVIHIGKAAQKVDHIKTGRAIFIDDSFAERKAVMEKLNIPVFAPDSIEGLMK